MLHRILTALPLAGTQRIINAARAALFYGRIPDRRETDAIIQAIGADELAALAAEFTDASVLAFVP